VVTVGLLHVYDHSLKTDNAILIELVRVVNKFVFVIFERGT